MNDISYFLFGVVGGLGVSTLARYSALTPSPRRSSASALSGSANRGDFSRAMQLEVVDSPRKISNLYLAWRSNVRKERCYSRE